MRISRRNESFRIEGAKATAERARGAAAGALRARAHGRSPTEQLQLALVEAAADAGAALPASRRRRPTAPIVLHTRRADLAGRTPNQVQYLRHILAHDITFGIGPAGTGKTFLAVACAVDALERSAVQRIVLTRPAVEAGERLGFLPGDLAQKVDPYLRPLYDALYDLMGFDRVTKAFEKGTLEIAPLAFMRGRTLNHAFVILDEAQNTTPEQMKMFLTRIGFGSKAVVTGDVSQIDLPQGHGQRPDRGRARAARASRASPSRASPRPTWCAIRWWRASSRPTTRARSERCGEALTPRWPRAAAVAAVRRRARTAALLPRHRVARWMRAALRRAGARSPCASSARTRAAR